MKHLCEAVAKRTSGKYNVGDFPIVPDVEMIKEFLDDNGFRMYVDNNLGLNTLITTKNEKCYTIADQPKTNGNGHGTKHIRFRDNRNTIFLVASFYDKDDYVTGGFFGTINGNGSRKWEWQEETDWNKFRGEILKHFGW